ncbi:MAG TPA: hypothetical protein VHC19_25770 [Pirellulales bacterium]|nr:hypothetical protein [Pirellulales bacterium]
MIRPTLCWLAAVLSLAAPGTVRGAEAERITLSLASGRTFTGAVDLRTTRERLWLRMDRGGMSILRPVEWQSIVEARRGEQRLSRPELLASIDQLRSARPPIAAQAPEKVSEPLPAETALEEPAPAAALIQTLQVDASVGSWSQGVDNSGIVLDVLPLDGEGNVVAADGTLEVDLYGDQYGSPTRGQDYRLLGHWVVRLEARQVTANGARFRLPFQAVSPEFRNDLSPYALVHVRLTAPGHGMFDATAGAIRLQRFNGMRGRLQKATGSQFFSNERTNRGHNEYRAW